MMNFSRFLTTFLFAAVLALISWSPAFSQVSLSIGIEPPPLPEYAQPECPGDGYIWTPGYWAYGDEGYYWVPGTWVQPPDVGLFWTPCYWGWAGNVYVFHGGYWGPHVGFYGGINYGYGYGGNGYAGGRWEGGHFAYNSAVNNINTTNIHNTYVDRTVINNNNAGRVSYNGGRGGVNAQPTAQDRQFSSERHIPATATQRSYVQAASRDRNQLASVNGGRPATLASPRPEAYAHGAAQHTQTEPMTGQDGTMPKQSASEKNREMGSSSPEKKTEGSTHMTSQKTEAKPETKMGKEAPPKHESQGAVHEKSQTHSATHTQKSASHAKTESHAGAHPAASHESHPATHAKQ
jgi:hypothetical protein